MVTIAKIAAGDLKKYFALKTILNYDDFHGRVFTMQKKSIKIRKPNKSNIRKFDDKNRLDAKNG